MHSAQVSPLTLPIAPMNEQLRIAQILGEISLQAETTKAEPKSCSMRNFGLMHNPPAGRVAMKVDETKVVDG